MRLHDWNEGPVRPHERTLNRPIEDRIQLLQACRLNISPILSLYRDDDASVREAIESACGATTALASADIGAENHSLYRVNDGGALERLARLLREKTFYVIDGHHRYETALAYMKERRSQAQTWTGDEPENFVLVALTAREDPGVIVLPTHRLLCNVPLPDDFIHVLERDFAVEDVSAAVHSGGWKAMRPTLTKAAGETVAFGLAMSDGRRLILRVRDTDDAARHMPSDSPASWRSLDAAALEAIVFRDILRIDQQSAATKGSLTFTHDGEEALRLVGAGDYIVAFLLSPAPIEQVLSMADAGERMPQKSTYFYPKMSAGLVMNPLD